MSTYRLQKLFCPRSIAIVGASPRERSVGCSIARNLRTGGFGGSLHIVNPNYENIDGLTTVNSVEAIAEVPDIVVIAAPPAAVPKIVAAAGAKGAAAAIIITAGLSHGTDSFADAAKQAARTHGLRLVGPNCLGVVVPSARFNASFAAHMPPAGDLALISQSGAIVAGMAEWGTQHSIGFSALVSIGDQVDVDFGDLLDFFALDRATRAILLYVESIKDARKFMSAARAAARTRPVVAIKSGRHAQSAKAAATHTGALAGSDAVYDAAFRRAGLLRVRDLEELFDAAPNDAHTPQSRQRLKAARQSRQTAFLSWLLPTSIVSRATSAGFATAVASGGAGFSASTSAAGLSSRSPLKAACRTAKPAPVQPANAISATRPGLVQFTFALRGASLQGHRTYVQNGVEPICDEYLASGNF